MKILNEEECLELLKENNLPINVINHSRAVCNVALGIVEKLVSKGIKVDKDLVLAGALLHDIRRLDKNHVDAGAELLESKGFHELARITKTHGLWDYGDEDHMPKTTEEKIVFYADKLVVEDKQVTLEERFKYLRERYSIDDKWYDFTKKIEKELIR